MLLLWPEQRSQLLQQSDRGRPNLAGGLRGFADPCGDGLPAAGLGLGFDRFLRERLQVVGQVGGVVFGELLRDFGDFLGELAEQTLNLLA